MKSFQLLLAVALPTVVSCVPFWTTHHQCLTTQESEMIVKNWLHLWTGDLSHINDIVTTNTIYYDRTQDLTLSKPSASGIVGLQKYIEADNAGPSAGLDQSGSLAPLRACDKISLNWVYYKPGTKVVAIQGIDILHIDLASKKIKESASYNSFADFFKYLAACNGWH